MPTSIPSGSQNTTFTITTPDTYTLAAGETRTQTAGTGIQVTVAAGTTTIDIEGTLTDTASGARAIRANVPGGQLIVGAAGLVQSTDGDAVQAQSANGRFDINNLGQIVSTTTIGAITSSGANPPGAAYALNFNAAVGAAGAPSSDFTSGGVITNGAAGSTAALIRSDSGDAIRLGAHETLVNYGTISGAGPINDSSTNNVFAGTSTATRYDISRGVRINAATATNDRIDNYGTIEGSQHGVDVGNTAAINIQVVNRAGALILGHNGSGVGADTVGTSARTVVVDNFGTIRGEYAPTFDRAGLPTVDGDGDGVDVDGSATVNNYAGGVIAGSGANGDLAGQGAGGYDSNGRANRAEGLSLGGGVVTNDGLISGGTGIVVNNDANPAGNRSGVLATQVYNGATGQIVGQSGYAIRFENKTGVDATDNDTIVNAGTITGNGTTPSGTVLLQDGSVDPGTVGTLDGTTYTAAANAGSARFIQGDGAAIQTGEGADALTNYGTITGNTGRALNLEGGDDALTLYTGSTVAGRIDGGAGTDTLNLRLDDRQAVAPIGLGSPGANSGATTGTLAAVVNFEVLEVFGGSWTIQDAQAYAGGVAIESGAALTIGAAGALTAVVGDAGTLTFAHAGALTQGGAISGAGSVVQAGSGTLTLLGGNTYAGGTTIQSGALELAARDAAGTGTIGFAAGAQTLQVDAAALGGDAGRTVANLIAGFSADGDVIDVRGIGQAAVARFDAATGLLTLTNASGATTYATLHLSGSYAGQTFTAASDGNGGSQVTVSAPLSVTAALASDTGASAVDHVTSVATISGTTSAGALIALTDESSRAQGGTTAGADGRYSLVPTALADGAHTLTVTGTYAGQSATAAVALTLDTHAPTLSLTGVSGEANHEGGHVLSGSLDLSGFGASDAGLSVTIRDGGTVLGTTTSDAGGHFSLAFSDTKDGPSHTYALAASATDAAGNAGASDTLNFALDYKPNRELFGTVAHDTSSHAGEVYALYEGLLGRAPDAFGAEGWIDALDHGTSLAQVTGAILSSSEAQAHLNAASDADYVEQLYATVLGRASDAPGKAGWVGFVDGGASRAEVAGAFVFSAEHQGELAGALQAGVYLPDPAEAGVARLYYGVLGRAPDAGGLTNWSGAAHNGVTLDTVAQNFLAGSEYQSAHANQTDAQFVAGLYAGALGRAPDQAGQQSWVDGLAHGMSRAQVAVAISEGPEAQAHLVGHIEQGWHLA